MRGGWGMGGARRGGKEVGSLEPTLGIVAVAIATRSSDREWVGGS